MTKRLPVIEIQDMSVRDYAYLWINEACPLHQWCSGSRGIDDGVIAHVRELLEDVKRDDRSYIPLDEEGMTILLAYLEKHNGHPAEDYIPDEPITV